MKRPTTHIGIQTIAVVTGIVLMLGKFLAFFLTHSNAILTDALESIVNVVAGLFGLYSLSLAAKPRDTEHPYGHGKIEFISASIEGVLIMIAGIAILIKSGYNIFYPVPISKLDIGLYITVVTGVVNYLLGFVLEKRGKNANSMTLVASGKHLKSDAYSTAGLIIGLVLILLTGYAWMDIAVAMLFGGIIIYTGYGILRNATAGIMDEADFSLLQRIIQKLDTERRPNWIDIHNLRIIKYGSMLHVDCHMTVPWYLNVAEAHDEVSGVNQIIDDTYGDKVELFIHIDGCLPLSCPICTKDDCPVRQYPFRERITWTLDNTLVNRKHTAEMNSES